jgi:hypothetical protein
MSPSSSRQLGDSFLLFHSLPYDFSQDPPFGVGPGVFLENTPHDVLQAAEDSALADYVLPGYNLPGHGTPNCCLRCSGSEARHLGREATDLFFIALTAFRLHAPLGIEVAGQFELGDQNDQIAKPTVYEICSSWQPDANAHYSAVDLGVVADIAARWMHIGQADLTRLVSAGVLFAQASCGHSKSLQMAYLALFAALDALFVPQGNKAKTLAQRVGNFLTRFTFPVSLNDWLKREYEQGRNNLAHGVQDVVPWARMRNHRVEDFGRLHEITRLSLLGFFSMTDQKLEILSSQSGTRLRTELDNLGQATGRYIDGQRFWCS